jgi:RNA polymerase sigma-70 factor (ECF subfamily)
VAPKSERTDSHVDPESSFELLQLVKAGDSTALDRLLRRYLVPLRKWARGRLPHWARDGADTEDLVQDAIVHTLRHLSHFDADGGGALHRYLRTAVMNRIRDELRRAHRRPPAAELDEEMAGDLPSPLSKAIGQETLAGYEAALDRLREEDRELIIARVEWGLDYQQLAAALGKPSAAAARMAVSRALYRLAATMKAALVK